jgi:GntR family transcriptional regulator, arabinose operon transcriptional repressor
VSRITSARAVNELERLGMVSRIRGKGSFVNDRSSWSVNNGSSPIISLVLPFSRQTGSGYVLLDGMETQARSQRQLITLHNSEESPQREKEIIADALKHKVQGLVIYPDQCLRNLDVFSDLIINKVPFVIIDREILGIGAPFVGPDNERASETLVAYLVSIGHRRIAYMGTTRTTVFSEQARFVGYCHGLLNAGIPIREDYLAFTDEMPASDSIAEWARLDENLVAGFRTLDMLMNVPDPPTAVVTVNDLTAAVLLQAALRRGLQVPEELSITGFDDLPVAAHLEVPLTTMAQPFYEIGETAVRLLQERIADPSAPVRRVLLPTTLKIRNSTAMRRHP